MTILEPELTATSDPLRSDDDRRLRTAVFWSLVAAYAIVAVFRLIELPPRSLTLDTGIQYHLVGETARGAIPIIDFEHGWNALGWYVGAVMFLLVGGHPGLYTWLWRHVSALFLATTAVLLVGRRLRLSAAWLFGLAGLQYFLTKPPNGKYAIPSLWLLALLPVGRFARGRWALATRLGLGAVTVLMHVDLTLMLVTGAVAFDLFARRDLDLRDRLVHAAATPLGAVAAFAGQLVVYDLLGMSPRALVRFLILDRGNTVEGYNFGYQLLRPRSLVQWLYPVSLFLPVVPAVWQRLTDPTRLAVTLHLALTLTAIRKSDPSHTHAAATLLAVMVLLVAHDCWQQRAQLRGERRASRPSLGPVLLGLAWLGGGLLVTFEFPSLLAWPAFLTWALAAVVGGALLSRSARTWVSIGAAAGAVLLLATSLVVRTVHVAGANHDPQVADITAAVAGDIDRCLGPDRRAWVIPHPLPVYETLDLEPATPFYLFWLGFTDELPRLARMMDAGEVPTIVVLNNLPPHLLEPLGGMIDARYELCLQTRSEEFNDLIRVYRWNGPPGG